MIETSGKVVNLGFLLSGGWNSGDRTVELYQPGGDQNTRRVTFYILIRK